MDEVHHVGLARAEAGMSHCAITVPRYRQWFGFTSPSRPSQPTRRSVIAHPFGDPLIFV